MSAPTPTAPTSGSPPPASSPPSPPPPASPSPAAPSGAEHAAPPGATHAIADPPGGASALRGLLANPTTLRRLALASLVSNVVIVVTGGAVRLTGSGLGCPTWPRCSGDSYVTTPALGVHGLVEFGNRLVTFVVGLLAILVVTALLARRERTAPPLWAAVAVLAGIPAQAVLGGVTVLTGLNPWLVGGHFLLSMAVIAAAYTVWRALAPDPPVTAALPAAMRHLAWLVTVVSAAVLVLGTVVTGSGRHGGDVAAPRNGLDPRVTAQVHTDLVLLLVGLSVAMWFALRALPAHPAVVRAAGALVAMELLQGVIGMAEYFTGVPAALVALHMLGACLVWLATLATLRQVRRQRLP